MNTERRDDEPTDEDLSAIDQEGQWDSTVDELFADSFRPQGRGKKPPPAQPVRNTKDLYTMPENWTRTRGVALVHAETQTLLGNFAEYAHLRVAGCRKLVREDGPFAVDGVEEVSGSWWLGEVVKPTPRRSWQEQRRAVMHLHLQALRVHAPAVEVVACLEYGGIKRIELATATRFAGEDGLAFLDLPAGTNLIEVMDHDAKVRLRMEIGL